MKKFIALALVTVFVCLIFASCGGNGTPDTSTETVPGQNSVQTTAPVSKEEVKKAENSGISFTELVVADNDECTFKITGIDPDNMWGYTLNAYLENKSADKTYTYSITSASINGVDCDPTFAADVAPGKKSNEEINFSTDDLTENGITEFTDIAISLRVYDSDDWSAENVAEQTVHIYPFGEEKATKFVRQPLDSDTVICDNDKVQAVVIGYENDPVWGYSVNLYLVNKTDTAVMFSVDEASVNGFMSDPYFATSIAAGTSSFTSVSWSDSTLEESGISDISEIEFKFSANNDDDWSVNPYFENVVTLKP